MRRNSNDFRVGPRVVRFTATMSPLPGPSHVSLTISSPFDCVQEPVIQPSESVLGTWANAEAAVRARQRRSVRFMGRSLKAIAKPRLYVCDTQWTPDHRCYSSVRGDPTPRE